MIPMLHHRPFARFRSELNMHRRGQTDARTTAFCTARTIISTFNAGHVQRQTKGAARWVMGWKGRDLSYVAALKRLAAAVRFRHWPPCFQYFTAISRTGLVPFGILHAAGLGYERIARRRGCFCNRHVTGATPFDSRCKTCTLSAEGADASSRQVSEKSRSVRGTQLAQRR